MTESLLNILAFKGDHIRRDPSELRSALLLLSAKKNVKDGGHGG
jgi:hypothetical protein